jgi:nucleotide-binding universal stress UspA family protein
VILNELFHVFRNTPAGREIFLQSVYFARRTKMVLRVYVPAVRQFVLYFDRAAVTITLDPEFLASPLTAKKHIAEAIPDSDVDLRYFEPEQFTAGALPEIPVDRGMMTCPRSVADLSTKVRLGHLGPKVRAIVTNAKFPVLVPAPLFREWSSITVFFDGSDFARAAVRAGMWVRDASGLPLHLFTCAESMPRAAFESLLAADPDLVDTREDWIFSEGEELREAVYRVPPDSLVVFPAFGRGRLRDMIFGGPAEQIHTLLPNNLLLVGPRAGR